MGSELNLLNPAPVTGTKLLLKSIIAGDIDRNFLLVCEIVFSGLNNILKQMYYLQTPNISL